MGWWPEASTSAEKADLVFFVIFALSVAFLVFITFLMVFFTIKYSKKRHPLGEPPETKVWLEVTWTLVPLVLFVGMFYFGWTNFEYTRLAPRDAMAVQVTARQWAWEFKYPNGKTTDKLYAALDKPFKLEVRSRDVIHGFYVPAFRLKVDAVPGQVNTAWFQSTRLGSYDIECTVICGVNHSSMLSKVVVVPVDAFERWYFGEADAPPPGEPAPAEEKTAALPSGAAEPPGLAALQAKDCLQCHSTDGTPMVGPTFQASFGSTEIVVEQGQEKTVTVDDAYLRRAIEHPGEEIVKGYPPVMPEGDLTDQQISDIIAYIKTLQKGK